MDYGKKDLYILLGIIGIKHNFDIISHAWCRFIKKNPAWFLPERVKAGRGNCQFSSVEVER